MTSKASACDDSPAGGRQPLAPCPLPGPVRLAAAVTQEIVALAEQAGLSVPDLAQRAHLPMRSISAKIRGYAVLDLAEVEALAEVLGADPALVVVPTHERTCQARRDHQLQDAPEERLPVGLLHEGHFHKGRPEVPDGPPPWRVRGHAWCGAPPAGEVTGGATTPDTHRDGLVDAGGRTACRALTRGTQLPQRGSAPAVDG